MDSTFSPRLRIGVVGGGIAGAVAALLLARDGHDVTLIDRVTDPRPVGAGFLLQPIGQAVLADLGVLAAVRDRSSPVRRFEGRTRSGRIVLDFGYDDHPQAAGLTGLGVHRATLFDLLWGCVGRTSIVTQTGFEIDDLRSTMDGWVLSGAPGRSEAFDLVIAADGARSRLRRRLGLATKDVGYPYAAAWTIVPDPDHLAGGVLTQTYDGTRVTLGFLPTGAQQASIFWLTRTRQLEAFVAAGPRAFVDRARPYAGRLRPLLERAPGGRLFGARYRDVVVPNPVVLDGPRGIVLIGDAAHAMSPQLGLGANLALADAWSLAAAVRAHPGDLPGALRAHARDRWANVRWYTWLSRIMTPVFQSDLVPIGWARDVLFGPIGRLPVVRRQFVDIELGGQTSPWTTWAPAARGGPLQFTVAARDRDRPRCGPPRERPVP